MKLTLLMMGLVMTGTAPAQNAVAQNVVTQDMLPAGAAIRIQETEGGEIRVASPLVIGDRLMVEYGASVQVRESRSGLWYAERVRAIDGTWVPLEEIAHDPDDYRPSRPTTPRWQAYVRTAAAASVQGQKIGHDPVQRKDATVGLAWLVGQTGNWAQLTLLRGDKLVMFGGFFLVLVAAVGRMRQETKDLVGNGRVFSSRTRSSDPPSQ